jgi:hypothetical protein
LVGEGVDVGVLEFVAESVALRVVVGVTDPVRENVGVTEMDLVAVRLSELVRDLEADRDGVRVSLTDGVVLLVMVTERVDDSELDRVGVTLGDSDVDGVVDLVADVVFVDEYVGE